MLTMDPPPVFCMAAMPVFMPRNTPLALTSMSLSHAVVLSMSGSKVPLMPALLTRTSSLPKADTAASTVDCQLASLVTSSFTNFACPPPAVILSAVWRPSVSSTSATMTLAPSRANSIASLCPMPLAPPLTIATLSLSLIAPPCAPRPVAGEGSTSPNTLWDNAGKMQLRDFRLAALVALILGSALLLRAPAPAGAAAALGPRRAAERGRLDRPGRDLLGGAAPGDRARVAHVLDEPRRLGRASADRVGACRAGSPPAISSGHPRSASRWVRR